MRVSVDSVGAGLGDHVQHNVSRLAVLRIVVVGQNLEFLYLFQRSTQRISQPGARFSKRSRPSFVVSVVRVMPVSVFVAVTLALGIDAPFGSNARPAIVAKAALCA